ncbi:MAG: hypothetical protein OXT68_02640 [Chloroflexota bacterium]|nr:hypothetical protein [Chloroflexota bacterium]MDE2949639.1 hypothetical protein [Chloroflexota bacterium]
MIDDASRLGALLKGDHPDYVVGHFLDGAVHVKAFINLRPKEMKICLVKKAKKKKTKN